MNNSLLCGGFRRFRPFRFPLSIFWIACSLAWCFLQPVRAGLPSGGYQVYNPTVTFSTLSNGPAHDATIVYFDGRWIAQWDDGLEAAPQAIWQSVSTDNLMTWSPPVMAYSSTLSSTAPLVPFVNSGSSNGSIQFQPSLVVVGKQLWSFFQTREGVYWSRLKEGSNELWSNTLLFGTAGGGNAVTGLPGGLYKYPKDVDGSYTGTAGVSWRIFPGNNGIVMSSGRVVVPVTMTDSTPNQGEFWEQRHRDSVIYSDNSGTTWNCSWGVTYTTTGTGAGRQCWESTVWEPTPGILNLVARNNRVGPPALNPRENLKFSRSVDGGVTWAAESLLSLDTAMSRPHVIRQGQRNIMAQNDWYTVTNSIVANRRNLSLFFSRGNYPNQFVAGLNFATQELVATGGNVDGSTMGGLSLCYPQIGTKTESDGSVTAAVVYTRDRVAKGSGMIRVARISSLPNDSTYYLFPRQGYRLDFGSSGYYPLQATTDTGHPNVMRFKDGWGSAGLDIDGSDSSSDNLYLTFSVKPETADRQCLFTTNSGLKLFTNSGTLTMKTWGDSPVEIACGTLPVGQWSTVALVTGNGISMAGSNGGAFHTTAFSKYPWQPFFGDNAYSSGISTTMDAKFLIDLNSVSAQVGPFLENFAGDLSITGSNSLVGQGSWTAIGSNPSPLINDDTPPPAGGKYLTDNGETNANTQAQRDCHLAFAFSNVLALSFDFYMGGGTALFGLKSASGTTLGPAIGYSGGLYLAQPTGGGTSSFARTATGGNVTLASGNWYRISSTFDFGRHTATLAYQTWNAGTSTWSSPVNLNFDPSQAPTTSLTADYASLANVYVRLANNGSSRLANLRIEPVLDTGSNQTSQLTAMSAGLSTSAAPVLVGAASRLVHSGSLACDIGLPLGGAIGVEPRRKDPAGSYSVVFSFDQPIASGAASLVGVGHIVGRPTVSGNQMTVNLTGIVDRQTLKLAVHDVVSSANGPVGSGSVTFRILQGDVTGDGIVSDADVNKVKGSLSPTLEKGSVSCDLDASGAVDAGDVQIVQSELGNSAL